MEIDAELLSRLDSNIQQIKEGLQKINAVPQTKYLSVAEFMEHTKISRWKFDLLIKEGLLAYRKIGRKYYINIDQVTKYFNGEMTLS